MTWHYPILMLAAVATGVIISRRTQQPLGLTAWQRFGIGLGAFCGAMIGAKLPFVVADWERLLTGAAWFDNGKTIVFGLVGGYFGVEIAKWSMQIRVKTGDSFAVPVAAAIAVGRLACFSVGCCYGTVTTLPWGVDFSGFPVARAAKKAAAEIEQEGTETTEEAGKREDRDAQSSLLIVGRDGPLDARPRHPTQLYEFAFHLAAACGLAGLLARGALRGQLIKLYILTYLAYRFATEFMRPEPIVWRGLTGYQLAAAAFAPLFALVWWRDSRTVPTQALAKLSE